MIKFKNFDALKDFLLRDKDTTTLNPVRIINVDSISMWLEVKNFLSMQSTKGILLSDFCEDEDTMPNIRRLYSALKNETQSAYIVPLSEFLRLNPEISADELKKILNISLGTKNFRLYFLMYRLQSVIESLQIDDPRKKNCLILLETAREDNYSLTVIQKSLQLKLAGNSADGLKKYLQYWERTPLEPLNLYTDNAIFLQDKIFFDDVKVIAGAFDLLRHHYKMSAELKRNFGTNTQWEKLAQICNREGNFQKVFLREFETENFQSKIFTHWSGDNFKRWFLWLWCKLQPKNFYAANCAVNSYSPEDFPAQIYSAIFDYVDDRNFEKIYNERKEILTAMKIPPPENFIDKVRQADKKIALKILTDTSTRELNLIFETLQKFSNAEFDRALKILQTVYPDLANYLSDDTKIFSDALQKYFRQYRRLKVTDKISADFYNLVEEFAEHKGRDVYVLKTRNQIVAEEYSDTAAIYFVDAMGAEYLDCLAKIFSTLDSEKFSVNFQVGYCALPTTTEFNKDFLTARNVAGETVELDEMKHAATNYPENIINELNFLSTLKEKILTALESFSKIILCADHGSSRLAVLARKTKFDKTFSSDGRKVYNCGRYADALPNDEKNFPAAIHDNDKIILADYSRFIQQGAPGNEIHGGATLEEWLVPVVTIERRLKNSSRKKISPPKRKGIGENKNFDI